MEATTTVDLTPEFFQDLIKVTDPGVVVHSIEVSTGSTRGDNYTSSLYRVTAKGLTSNHAAWNRAFICKCLPQSKARREAFKSETLFRNEVAFYTKALPALLEFQSRRRINGPRFEEVPKVYLARSNLLVLEDLKERRYVMADRKQGLDLQHCEAVITSLAKFHALSFAMKSLEPALFTLVTSSISECLFLQSNESWYREYYRAATSNALAVVHEGLALEERRQYLEPFERFVEEDFFGRMVQLVRATEPLAVLCHGDCWTNNILFSYDDGANITKMFESLETPNPALTILSNRSHLSLVESFPLLVVTKPLRFIDFQLSRYASPALDLVNLLYCCTSRPLRTSHMPSLLASYCTTLDEVFHSLGCSGDELSGGLFLERMKEEVHRCATFGLGLAIDMIPISTCDSEQAPDLYSEVDHADLDTRHEVEQPVWTTSEVCRRRMTDLVQELVDSGDL